MDRNQRDRRRETSRGSKGVRATAETEIERNRLDEASRRRNRKTELTDKRHCERWTGKGIGWGRVGRGW